jgi:hypothetical protein
MAVYKTEHGFQIKHRSSDPSNPIAGEIWYNTTTQQVKVTPLIGAWASGENMNNADSFGAGAGTQTAALKMAGQGPPRRICEEYNGTSWTETNDTNTDHFITGGFGTQTAAVIAGGMPGGQGQLDTVEEYDGTSWTNVTAMPAARQGAQGAGILTAGFMCGGRTDPGSPQTETYEYDGTNWTDGGDLNTGGTQSACLGTQTAALLAGRGPAAPHVAVEEYNGSTWSEQSATLGTARYAQGAAGTQTAGLVCGGWTPSPNTKFAHVEEYDGTSFTEVSNLGTARYGLSGDGIQTSAVMFGGGTPTNQTATEEYTKAATVRVLDTST